VITIVTAVVGNAIIVGNIVVVGNAAAVVGKAAFTDYNDVAAAAAAAPAAPLSGGSFVAVITAIRLLLLDLSSGDLFLYQIIQRR
jgi:hypothetical protein